MKLKRPPQEFLCPYSQKPMENPMVPGQTYDRSSLDTWWLSKNDYAPKKDQQLYIPNSLVQKMIQKWCKASQFNLIIPRDRKFDEEAIIVEFENLSVSQDMISLDGFQDMIRICKLEDNIRHLTARSPSFRSFFANSSGRISKLLAPLLLEDMNNSPRWAMIMGAILNIIRTDDYSTSSQSHTLEAYDWRIDFATIGESLETLWSQERLPLLFQVYANMVLTETGPVLYC